MNREAWLAEARADLESARARRDDFAALPREISATQATRDFDRIRGPLDRQRGWAGLFAQVHPDGSVRSAAMDLEQEIASFETALSLDRGVCHDHARNRATTVDNGNDIMQRGAISARDDRDATRQHRQWTLSFK